MKRSLLSVLGFFGLLALLLAGCDAPNAVTMDTPEPQFCAPADAVDVQVSGGSAINAPVLGVSDWSCLEDGDRIRYLWRRPHRAVAARNELIVSMALPSRWTQSFTFRPDEAGQWTLEVYRNDVLAASAPFTVQ